MATMIDFDQVEGLENATAAELQMFRELHEHGIPLDIIVFFITLGQRQAVLYGDSVYNVH